MPDVLESILASKGTGAAACFASLDTITRVLAFKQGTAVCSGLEAMVWISDRVDLGVAKGVARARAAERVIELPSTPAYCVGLGCWTDFEFLIETAPDTKSEYALLRQLMIVAWPAIERLWWCRSSWRREIEEARASGDRERAWRLDVEFDEPQGSLDFAAGQRE